MFTVVRSDINFKLNSSNMIDVIENDIKIGEIDTALYVLLTMFNGYLNDEHIKKALATLGHRPNELFDLLTDNFDYILIKSTELKKFFPKIPIITKYINFSKIRSLVPKTIVISLTRDCFMKCKYCYAGAFYSAKARKSNSLDFKLLKQIVMEMKLLNIKQVNITGGDPFSREDIFDILKLFKENKIFVDISTKKCFEDEEIEKLMDYKDSMNLQISIDSLDDSIQNDLIAYPNYSLKMIKVLEKLVNNGFTVKTNSVVTAYNISDIPNLIYKLDEIGIKTCILSPYTNNLCRSNTDLFPEIEEYEKLNKFLNQLDLDIHVQKETFLRKLDGDFSDDNSRVCSAGQSGFVISPNGNVGICERMVYHDEFSIGNIKDQSLLELWDSSLLKTYHSPNPELFKGTKCYDCKDWNNCVEVRGICYVHSILINKVPFSPDAKCRYYSGEQRIF